MEFKWLEDFVCLANTGSFWKASEERNVSQPGFSRRIRALENWLGVTLIDRSSYPVSLTPYGRQFLPCAQEMLKASRNIREEFRMLAGAAANEVRIATLHTLSIYLIGADELIPVASQRFARAHAVENLRDEGEPLPFLAYSSFSFSEKLIAPVAGSLGRRLKAVYENSLSESLKAMVLHDCGVAWLPRSTISEELERGDLKCVGDETLAVQIKVKAYRLKGEGTSPLNAMWDML